MRPLSEFTHHRPAIVFTDIDGTLTENGRLPDISYSALWRLHHAGIKVVPVTGRPAGWCDLIARQWPVHGVIGENGALIYRYYDGRMHRSYAHDKSTRRENRLKLNTIAREVKKAVPASAIAADQFSRLFDLAIDFAEDVTPLPLTQAKKIQAVFEAHGAHAKISSIHVNGWFGNYDKLTTCRIYCIKELGASLDSLLDRAAFVGDSPNDEPMFGVFKLSFGVANISDFAAQLKTLPAFVSTKREGAGFAEIAEKLLSSK